MPADDFIRRVAKDALGAAIPTQDDSVQVLGDDGVVGGFHDCAQTLQEIASALMSSNIEGYAAGVDKFSFRAEDTRTDGNQRMEPSLHRTRASCPFSFSLLLRRPRISSMTAGST